MATAIWPLENGHKDQQKTLRLFSNLLACRLRTPRPATGVSQALRARSVPGVSPTVSPKMGGVRGSVRRGVSEGLRRAPETPRRTLPRTPPILGTLSGTLRAQRARETPVADRGVLKFSLVFDKFLHFSLVFTFFGLSVSDRFLAVRFRIFLPIRLLPFSGCHLESPE